MTPKEEKFYNALDIVRECFENSYSDGIDFANNNKEFDRDPKHLGIPNINFSLCEDDSERAEIYRKQRMERGFDDSETWSLDYTIAKFILPRLKRFKEVTNGYPGGLSEEEWDEILDKMIYAFDLKVNYDSDFDWKDGDQKKFDEGIKLFSEWFLHLWW